MFLRRIEMKRNPVVMILPALCLLISAAVEPTASSSSLPLPVAPTVVAVQGDDLVKETDFLVRLLSPMSTKVNKKGDSVTAEVISPRVYRGYIMEGVVKESKSGGSIKSQSVLTFTFEKLIRDKETILISSSIKSFKNSKGQEMVDEEGNVVEKKNNVGAAVAGAAAGAVIGGILGGTKGAGIGAGVGAATALVLIKMTVRGANVTFDSGSQFLVGVTKRKAK
jgi:hypothetical protein